MAALQRIRSSALNRNVETAHAHPSNHTGCLTSFTPSFVRETDASCQRRQCKGFARDCTRHAPIGPLVCPLLYLMTNLVTLPEPRDRGPESAHASASVRRQSTPAAEKTSTERNVQNVALDAPPRQQRRASDSCGFRRLRLPQALVLAVRWAVNALYEMKQQVTDSMRKIFGAPRQRPARPRAV